MMLTEKECNEALDWLYALSVSCKEEVHEHRSSFLGEKYNLIKQLIEEHFDKETHKKPKGISVTHEGRVGNCPSCGKFIREEQNKHICDCGQRIDWSE